MHTFDVAAYIWPSYHFEPRMERFWPERDGEWYTVRRGTPRFPGHDMPRIPLLGHQDEADPAVMREHVELARAHGINVFIVDWYWYENAPCFERQLNEGLLPALEGTDSRFFLMWANHDAATLWDMHTDENRVLWSGQVDRATLDPMFERVIERYLARDTYYRIDGKPVFSIYDVANLIAGLGGVSETRAACDHLRARAEARGLGGLHLQTIARTTRGPEAGAAMDAGSERAAGAALGFDSATSYQFVHDAPGRGDYVTWADRAMARWPDYETAYGVYYPHASIGWDNTQRNPSVLEAVQGTTPDAFEACLWRARRFLEARPDITPLVTLNSWNEWTEGSYLLPDMRWGYRYLQAVRNVFGPDA